MSTGTQISDMTVSSAPDGSYFPFVVTDAATGLNPTLNYRVDLPTYLSATYATQAALAAAGGSGLIGYLESGTGAVLNTVNAVMQTDPINVLNYIPANLRASVIAGSNTTALTTYLQAALDAAKAENRALFFPAGAYKTGALTWTVSSYFPYETAFGAGPRIIGMGSGLTTFQMSDASAYLLTVTTDTTNKFALGGLFSGFSVVPAANNPASASGIKITRSANFLLFDVHFISLTGTGFRIANAAGDTDSSSLITLNQCRFEGNYGWGADVAADSGHNEINFVNFEQCFWEGNGTAADKTITGITQANPAVVTSNGHGLTNGTTVVLYNVAGMTQLNGRRFTVAGTATNTFQLSGVDSTGYTAYVSGGVAASYSGALIWKGQICSLNQCGFTVNHNAAVLIPGESGLGQTFSVRSTAFENNIGRHVVTSGIVQFQAREIQFYNNNTYIATNGIDFECQVSGAEDIDINGVVVRATASNSPYTAFNLRLSGSTAITDQRVRNVRWDNFGYSGQIGLSGWTSEPISINARLTTAAGSVTLLPAFYSQGNKVPFRQAYGNSSSSYFATGTWIAASVPSTGITVTTSGTAISTTYNVYFYDGGNTMNLEVSATAPTVDTASGYQVKTGEGYKLWVGRVRTDGSGNFLTGVSANWLNPVYVSGEWQWADASGNAFMKAGDGTYTSLPSSDTDGVKIGGQ